MSQGLNVHLHIAMSDEPVDFLRQKSVVYKSRLQAAEVTDVLVIDDSAIDANAVGALLRCAFGRDIIVRHATNLMRAKNMLLEGLPAAILLDDILPPRDRAESSMAILRQSGYSGPIIVLSGEMTRLRRLNLLQAGALSVLHKDDLNATALAQALTAPEPVPETAAPHAPLDEVLSDDSGCTTPATSRR